MQLDINGLKLSLEYNYDILTAHWVDGLPTPNTIRILRNMIAVLRFSGVDVRINIDKNKRHACRLAELCGLKKRPNFFGRGDIYGT